MRLNQTTRKYYLTLMALIVMAFFLSQSGSTQTPTPQWSTNATDTLYNNPTTSKVGIGITTPEAQLHVAQQIRIDGLDANGFRAIGFGGNSTATSPTIYSNHNYLVLNAKPGQRLYLNWDNATGSTNIQANGGNVGIGTSTPQTKLHVVGDVRVDGNIAAKYQDVAEWVQARHALAAGTVVVLDTEASNRVRASSQSYDTRVAGVVTSSPGLILGEAGAGKVMVATTGRVKVKVDATRGSIAIGDLLVTSDKEGIAMRSQPLELGGARIHRPGTLIGKALERLDKGVGNILVLLSLQ